MNFVVLKMFNTSVELTSLSFISDERYESRNPNIKNIIDTAILPVFNNEFIDDPVDTNSFSNDTPILIGATNNTPKIIALNTAGYFSNTNLITLAKNTKPTIPPIPINTTAPKSLNNIVKFNVNKFCKKFLIVFIVWL